MSDNSRTASILVLIGAILTFIFIGILIIILGAIAFFSFNRAPIELWMGLGIFLIIVIGGIGMGSLKLWASNLIKDPEEKKKGGIIALIAGIIFGPDILSIIGGIIALSDNGTN